MRDDDYASCGGILVPRSSVAAPNPWALWARAEEALVVMSAECERAQAVILAAADAVNAYRAGWPIDHAVDALASALAEYAEGHVQGQEGGDDDD